MIYNNRHYPHPVLGIEDDIKGTSQVKLKVSSDATSILLENSFNMQNEDLQKLIDDKKASYCIHLCYTGTFFRQNYTTYKSIADTIKIPSSNLNGEVELDYFICAEESIQGYNNKLSNEDYENNEFNLSRGDILAYLGKGKFYANKTFQEINSISSFMNVNTDGKSNHPFYIDYNDEKITIYLSQEDYELYQEIKLKKFSPILHAALVLPALLHMIFFIETEESLDYKNKTWFKVLNEILEKLNESDPLKAAQKILDLPLARAFNSLKDIQSSF